MPMRTHPGGWQQTGRWRWRKRFMNDPILEVEMERKVWTPMLHGRTPHNYKHETCWMTGRERHNYPPEGKTEQ